MKTFTLRVTQTDTYMKEYTVTAESATEAIAALENDLQNSEGLETMNGTYESTDREIEVESAQ